MSKGACIGSGCCWDIFQSSSNAPKGGRDAQNSTYETVELASSNCARGVLYCNFVAFEYICGMNFLLHVFCRFGRLARLNSLLFVHVELLE